NRLAISSTEVTGMKNQIHTENIKTHRTYYLVTGVLAFLLILAYALPSSPPERNSTPERNTYASDASATITSPSSFPNIKIKKFGQMDEHFYRGAQPEPGDYKTLAGLGVKTIVDLRDDPTKYEKKDAEEAGIKYVNVRMSDKKKPADE